MMLKIALDLDNCILDTVSTIINLHNKLSDSKLEYKNGDNLDWKFKPLIKTDEELSELFKLFDHEDFYKEPIVFDNAIEVINQLSMQNQVCIISKHMESRKGNTRKWIYEIFPTVELIFVDDFKQKGEMLKDFDIILDDRIDALESCSDVKCKICFGNYLWNETWTGLRVTNWINFKRIIDKIILLEVI